RYQGNFIKGIPQGKGTYIHADGIKFDGVFRDGLPWRGEEIDSTGKQIRRYAFGRSVE
ncbi:MAG: membrane-binding protein, partial [bacterium]